jgi:hypothetical protein
LPTIAQPDFLVGDEEMAPMRLQFRVVVVLALLAAQAIGTAARSQKQEKEPTAVMVVVLENNNGKKTIETTPIGEAACRHAVRVFNEVGPFNITVRSPDRKDIAISGRAIEVQCVLPGGSIVGTHPTNLPQKP